MRRLRAFLSAFKRIVTFDNRLPTTGVGHRQMRFDEHEQAITGE
jgi:hypothetical protein